MRLRRGSRATFYIQTWWTITPTHSAASPSHVRRLAQMGEPVKCEKQFHTEMIICLQQFKIFLALIQWRRYTRARQVKWPGWKIHRPGSALPSSACCFASVIVWTENKNVKMLPYLFQEKTYIPVTWLEDILTSKWPGSFTALVLPLLWSWLIYKIEISEITQSTLIISGTCICLYIRPTLYRYTLLNRYQRGIARWSSSY